MSLAYQTLKKLLTPSNYPLLLPLRNLQNFHQLILVLHLIVVKKGYIRVYNEEVDVLFVNYNPTSVSWISCGMVDLTYPIPNSSILV
jgi:hypothetical protein